MSMRKLASVSVSAAVMAFAAPVAVHAAPFDITTLSGYQVVNTSIMNFSDTGWGGWSISGKAVLGAKIISTGDSVSDFSVFRPVGPGTVTPFGYTYGANEYGFIFRDSLNKP